MIHKCNYPYVTWFLTVNRPKFMPWDRKQTAIKKYTSESNRRKTVVVLIKLLTYGIYVEGIRCKHFDRRRFFACLLAFSPKIFSSSWCMFSLNIHLNWRHITDRKTLQILPIDVYNVAGFFVYAYQKCRCKEKKSMNICTNWLYKCMQILCVFSNLMQLNEPKG